jgi:hypothetical protein
MSSVAIIAFGAALLLLMWLAGRGRSEAASSASGDLSSEYVVRLPPRGLLGRCLAIEDVEYAEGLRSREVLRLLLRERRRLALGWLRQTRREASRLFRLHIRLARHAPDLRPAAELKLIFQLGVFFLLYQVLAGVVSLYGPFRARSFVNSVHSLADVLARLGGRIAENIVPGAALPVAPVRMR